MISAKIDGSMKCENYGVYMIPVHSDATDDSMNTIWGKSHVSPAFSQPGGR